MDFLTEGGKVLFGVLLGVIVEVIRNRRNAVIAEKVEEVNLKRDLDHLKRTQTQHGHFLAQLDSKFDRMIVFIKTLEGRVNLLESQQRTQQGLKN